VLDRFFSEDIWL